MYNFKSKKFTEQDLHRYRKKYIVKNIFISLLTGMVNMYILALLYLFQKATNDSSCTKLMFLIFGIIILFLLMIDIFFRLRELIKKDTLFITKTGVFNCFSSRNYPRHYRTTHYFINNNIICTSGASINLLHYNFKNVDVYFYINSKNREEAFLLNQLD